MKDLDFRKGKTMAIKKVSERTKDRFVFLCTYIEDILILLGLISIVVAAYLVDIKLGLFAQGIVMVWLGFIFSKILK